MQRTPTRLEKTRRLLKNPTMRGVLTFLFFVLMGLFILYQRYQILKEAEQREMSNLIGFIENNIDNTLKSSYSAALSLALIVDSEGDITGFNEVATQLRSEERRVGKECRCR